MGTTLTGTTPQDTYESLIKVADNGPLSATAKFLSDGEGLDSALSLSTTAVGIGTASLPTSFALGSSTTGLSFTSASNALNSGKIAVLKQVENGSGNGDLTIETYAGGAGGGERMRITSTGNVLISAAAPVGARNELRLGGNSAGSAITMGRSGTNVFLLQTDSDDNVYLENTANTFMAFSTNNVERIRILAGGGLTFNGDTAAANALDDYEEGTFTATLKGITDPTTPVTTTGTYTKIGRQVTVRGAFSDVNTTGATGDVVVAGMPFTNAAPAVGSVMIFSFDLDTSTAQNCFLGASTTLEFFGQKDDAAWVTLKHTAGAGRYLNFTITYFV